jgi:hypothetical protein
VFRCFCLPIALFIIRTLSFILVLCSYLFAIPSYSSGCVISVLVVSYFPCLVVFAFLFLYLSSELYLLSWCCALTYLSSLLLAIVFFPLLLLFLNCSVSLFLPSYCFIYHQNFIFYPGVVLLLICHSFIFVWLCYFCSCCFLFRGFRCFCLPFLLFIIILLSYILISTSYLLALPSSAIIIYLVVLFLFFLLLTYFFCSSYALILVGCFFFYC